ncbi:F-box/kelch-repeat protein At3g06240-like [Papaver somniferum]|uniref:F-box/kelch-repeat protein At3g06240-like n=1 Tax=Papaver somniferum TaxID=3469 RepID=UPI000E6FE219|nr:F-box/kelch-repeat protein At3g06240-like [Papaver somniferum]
MDYNSLSSKLSSAAGYLVDEAAEMDFPKLASDSLTLLGSCDGLVCLSDYDKSSSYGADDICIWNPSTKEYKNIPTPPNSEHSNMDQGLYGFGYDDKIADFKLVRVAEIPKPVGSSDGCEDGSVMQILTSISDTSSEVKASWVSSHSVVQIYTLGSNSWRTCQCQDMPYYFPDGIKPGVLVNGALHWYAVDKREYYEAIISFDMTNEIFKEVARITGSMLHPVVCDYSIDYNNVSVLGGCLCILHKTYGVKVDVWVMQEYGVKESWTKKFTITQKSITETGRLKIVCEFQNNEIIFDTDTCLVYYDPNNNIDKRLRIHGASMYQGVEQYVTSIVTLGSGTYVEKPKTRKRKSSEI